MSSSAVAYDPSISTCRPSRVAENGASADWTCAPDSCQSCTTFKSVIGFLKTRRCFRVRDRAAVLIDDEDDGKACVQQLTFALRSRLLHRVKDFLKRDDRDDRRDDVLIVCAAEYRLGNRQRHLLSGTDDLRTAHDAPRPFMRQDFAHARVDLFEPDHLGLKRTVQRAVDRPERQGDEIWVFL